jgi:indole-3-glycerol phosphate synthase
VRGTFGETKMAALTGTRRFSEAISEGDGISLIVEIDDPESARAAEAEGAEGILVRRRLDGLREATTLPILWAADGPLSAAREVGADACLLRFTGRPGEELAMEDRYAEAQDLGLDCVVGVRDEDELELALERLDPEILLLAARPDRDDEDDPLEQALDLLPDVPAGKLAIADVPVSDRDAVVALERAGMDAVIVGAGNVAALVGGAPPDV